MVVEVSMKRKYCIIFSELVSHILDNSEKRIVKE